MRDHTAAKRKRIASEQTTDEPDHIGRDATGADHFWSMYDSTVIVVSDAGIDSCDLIDTEPALAQWREYTAAERGWDFHFITAEPLIP